MKYSREEFLILTSKPCEKYIGKTITVVATSSETPMTGIIKGLVKGPAQEEKTPTTMCCGFVVAGKGKDFTLTPDDLAIVSIEIAE